MQRKQLKELLLAVEQGLQPPQAAPPEAEPGAICWAAHTVCSPGGWAVDCVRAAASKAASLKHIPSAATLLVAAESLTTSPAYLTKDHPPHLLNSNLEHYLVKVRRTTRTGLYVRASWCRV